MSNFYYNKIKNYTNKVFGISEEELLSLLPYDILKKIENQKPLEKNDYKYFKETYNLPNDFFGNLFFEKKYPAEVILSKKELEELIFIESLRKN